MTSIPYRLISIICLFFILSLYCNANDDKSIKIIENELPIADPYVLFHNGKYYAYGTRIDGFEVYISDDLKHWKRNKNLALSPQDSWGTRWFWAPEVYYVTAKKK